MNGTKQRIGLIRLAYLTPIVSAAILLILALLPRVFYTSGEGVGPDFSLFQLQALTYETGMKFFSGESAGSTPDFYFYLYMLAFRAISVICMVYYGIFSIFTALMAPLAWTPQARSTPRGNKWKRWYRIVVPNRGFFVFLQFLPLFPALYPYLFQITANKLLGTSMKACYYGIPDFIIVLLLAALSVALFLLTKSHQKQNRMDLFRIYKIEDQ